MLAGVCGGWGGMCVSITNRPDTDTPQTHTYVHYTRTRKPMFMHMYKYFVYLQVCVHRRGFAGAVFEAALQAQEIHSLLQALEHAQLRLACDIVADNVCAVCL